MRGTSERARLTGPLKRRGRRGKKTLDGAHSRGRAHVGVASGTGGSNGAARQPMREGTAHIRLSAGRMASLGVAGAFVLACIALVDASARAEGAGTGARTARKAGSSAPSDDRSQVRPYELQLVELITSERKQRGLPSLKLSPKLSRVARRHSEEMRDMGYMGHISPVPARSTPLKRFQSAFEYEPYVIGENVARRAGPQWCLTADRIEKTHQGLMSSTHHRENILRPEFEQLGIGIAVNDNGDYWVTELFVCVPAPEAKATPKQLAKTP